METIKVRCVGTRPMLMNRMPQHILQNLYDREKKAKNSSNPSPRDACLDKVYSLDNKLYIPDSVLFAALVNAGRHVRLDGKSQISTADSTKLPQYMQIMDEIIWLIDPETNVSPIWEVDMRKGTNPNGNEAVAIVRPRLDRWFFDVHINVFTEEIAIEKIRNLFDIAGRAVGLLDFRPQRKGNCGTFVVDCWDKCSITHHSKVEERKLKAG